MTLEELQDKILELTETKNQMANEIELLKTQTKEKELEVTSIKEETSKRILELQEHNQKLFLKVTQKQEEKPKEEFKSKLLGDYANGLDEEHLNILKQLEEGID